MNITSGRRNSWENFSHAFMGISTTSRFRRVSAFLSVDFAPVKLLEQVGQVFGDEINDVESSAFSAVIDALSTTADLAHSTLRLRLSAMDSMKLEA